MLNRDVVLAGVKLWAYGPAGVPEFDVELPADATSLDEPAHSLKYSLQDGRFDLYADCQVLQQYHDHPQIDNKRSLQIVAAVGSADLTCIANRRVIAALQRLEPGAVKFEYHEVRPGSLFEPKGLSLSPADPPPPLPLSSSPDRTHTRRHSIQTCVMRFPCCFGSRKPRISDGG